MAKQQQSRTSKEPEFIEPAAVPPGRPDKCPEEHDIIWHNYSGVGICLLHPDHPGIWVYEDGHLQHATGIIFRLGLDLSHMYLVGMHDQAKTNRRLGQLRLARRTLQRALDAFAALGADDAPNQTLRQDIVALMHATNDIDAFPTDFDYLLLEDQLERVN